MKTIPLRNRAGEVVAAAMVDDDDYESISGMTWHRTKKGYAGHCTYVDRRVETLTMHRFIMDAPERLQVDHIDGDRLNNQRSNLRLATNQQNCQNLRMRSTNRSGYRGVYWYERGSAWRAQVGRVYLGTFTDPTEAGAVAAAYRAEHMPFSQEASAQ